MEYFAASNITDTVQAMEFMVGLLGILSLVQAIIIWYFCSSFRAATAELREVMYVANSTTQRIEDTVDTARSSCNTKHVATPEVKIASAKPATKKATQEFHSDVYLALEAMGESKRQIKLGLAHCTPGKVDDVVMQYFQNKR